VRAKGLTVNLDEYDAAMARQREMAREAWTGSGQQAGAAEWLAIRDRLGLTHREAEVLTWVAYGKTNREIGQILDISPRTVEIYRANLMDKLKNNRWGEVKAAAPAPAPKERPKKSEAEAAAEAPAEGAEAPAAEG
jgi:DNA-binding CsgD family transcriptional regulator